VATNRPTTGRHNIFGLDAETNVAKLLLAGLALILAAFAAIGSAVADSSTASAFYTSTLVGSVPLPQRDILGDGVAVAVLDTGALPPGELETAGLRVIAQHDLLSDASPPFDGSGHGTHIASAVTALGPGADTGCNQGDLDVFANLAGEQRFLGPVTREVVGTPVVTLSDAAVLSGTDLWADGTIWTNTSIFSDGTIWGDTSIFSDGANSSDMNTFTITKWLDKSSAVLMEYGLPDWPNTALTAD